MMLQSWIYFPHPINAVIGDGVLVPHVFVSQRLHFPNFRHIYQLLSANDYAARNIVTTANTSPAEYRLMVTW